MRSHSTTSRDEPNKLKGNPVAATMHATHLGASNESGRSKQVCRSKATGNSQDPSTPPVGMQVAYGRQDLANVPLPLPRGLTKAWLCDTFGLPLATQLGSLGSVMLVETTWGLNVTFKRSSTDLGAGLVHNTVEKLPASTELHHQVDLAPTVSRRENVDFPEASWSKRALRKLPAVALAFLASLNVSYNLKPRPRSPFSGPTPNHIRMVQLLGDVDLPLEPVGVLHAPDLNGLHRL